MTNTQRGWSAVERREQAMGSTSGGPRLRRRSVLRAAAAGSAAAVVGQPSAWAEGSAGVTRRLDFSVLPPGEGWGAQWRTAGVANLRRVDGQGVLEAGSDVFPCDPRPVAFAVDCRVLDGGIRATVHRAGQGAGLVLRRVGPSDYYAAIFDGGLALTIVRRSGTELRELARAPVPVAAFPITMSFEAAGSGPSRLEAKLVDVNGLTYRASASDATVVLQRPGDPGVLATANTLFPSGNSVVPALGNLHLAPYGVQEGQALMDSPVGAAVLGVIRERSTAVFGEIAISSGEDPRGTAPSVVAAITGVPVAAGARVQIASDLPAEIRVDLSATPDFARVRSVRLGGTGDFDALIGSVPGLAPGRRVYWRPRLRRNGLETLGPTRSLRVLPAAGSPDPVTLAVGSCGSQFGPNFDHIADRDPDVFLWQGDLNYPDTNGPLAQTMTGYAGMWREFLANPRTQPILSRSCFAAVRDDHDYGLQDANAATIPTTPWGVKPWDALVNNQIYYRFSAGLADVWVLNQRHFKSAVAQPDTPDKTLLGAEQRAWLLDTLAASSAPLKVICSPCTVVDTLANARDGNWGAGYTAERRLVLDHIAREVSGRTIFLSGDTHVTMVYDNDGVFEARACPLDIPEPNDITVANPTYVTRLQATPGVVYANGQSHFSHVEIYGSGPVAVLDYTIVRQDGATPYTKRIEQPVD